MLAHRSFVVTEPDGSAAVFANVRNETGFRACLAGTGRTVRAATDADLDAAGIGAAIKQQARASGAPVAFGGFVIARLPAGSRLQ